MNDQNSKRLFYGSCFALITTAFSFSIRAGILPQLGETFNLTAQQLGFINSMFFYGFPISMLLGGIFYSAIGPKNIMICAFVAHTLGIVMTVYAGGYTGLLISTLFIGIGNGCTEAACNPMIATAYSGKQMNTLLNRFHMWFPGGIVLGSLVSLAMTKMEFGMGGSNMDHHDSNIDLCIPLLRPGIPTSKERSCFAGWKSEINGNAPFYLHVCLYDAYCYFGVRSDTVGSIGVGKKRRRTNGDPGINNRINGCWKIFRWRVCS